MKHEFSFIDKLRRRSSARVENLRERRSDRLRFGIGDDAAVLRQNGRQDLVVSADLLVEDIDFRRDWTNASWLGHKALAVSLSDIAAMGARPSWGLVSVGVPDSVWNSRFLDQFYSGWFALADKFDTALIGGDLSRTPEHIVIDSIVGGEIACRRALLRSNARPGDLIYVTGSLGGAAAGLQLLEAGHRLPLSKSRPQLAKRTHTSSVEKHHTGAISSLIQRQLCPTPRIEWGAFLASKRLASAAIDISDGLSSDLGHICKASCVGAIVDIASLPMSANALLVMNDRAKVENLALHGGEDYELIFTVPPRKRIQIPQTIESVTATCIGVITTETGKLSLRGDGKLKPLKRQGYRHFQR